jgi:hypothetical protein
MPDGLTRAIAPAARSSMMDGEGSDAMASVKTSNVNPKYKRKYSLSGLKRATGLTRTRWPPGP